MAAAESVPSPHPTKPPLHHPAPGTPPAAEPAVLPHSGHTAPSTSPAREYPHCRHRLPRPRRVRRTAAGACHAIAASAAKKIVLMAKPTGTMRRGMARGSAMTAPVRVVIFRGGNQIPSLRRIVIPYRPPGMCSYSYTIARIGQPAQVSTCEIMLVCAKYSSRVGYGASSEWSRDHAGTSLVGRGGAAPGPGLRGPEATGVQANRVRPRLSAWWMSVARYSYICGSARSTAGHQINHTAITTLSTAPITRKTASCLTRAGTTSVYRLPRFRMHECRTPDSANPAPARHADTRTLHTARAGGAEHAGSSFPLAEPEPVSPTNRPPPPSTPSC
jgi:hypothetical protein